MALYEYIADGGLFDSYGGLVLFSGAATVTTRYVHRPTVSGGMTIDGTVTPIIVKSYTGTSGFNTGRGASVLITKDYTATSGLTSGGSAGVAKTHLYSGTGDLVTDGAGTTSKGHCNEWIASGNMSFGLNFGGHSRTKDYPASGGMVSGDTGSHSFTKIATLAENGGVFDGSATTLYAHDYIYTVSGGLTTGGIAPVLSTKDYLASAGLSLDGTATITSTASTIKTYAVTSGGLLSSGNATVISTAITIKTYAASAGLSSSGSATVTRTVVVIKTYVAVERAAVFNGSAGVTKVKHYSSSPSVVSLSGSSTTSKARFATYTSTGTLNLAGMCTSAAGNDFPIIAELFSITFYPRTILLPSRTLQIPGHTKVYVGMTGKEFRFCLEAYPGLRVRAHRQVLDRVYSVSGGMTVDGSDCA